ncbi:MAG: hypothetical protein BGO87_12955 [Flavobacteriia bacterium 40-80]|nr:MAG: hypothetical protein BGO87_12955 [Flavobacteriia bacterium 40-80]
MFAVILVGFFVIHLIRRNLTQENKRKQELSLLEEKHLKDLLNKHVRTQEHERERIGSDLHDAISNRLNMILLKLRVSNNKNDIEEDINETINAVRRIAHDLNPPMIDKIPIDVLVMAQFDRLLPKYEVRKWSKSLSKTIWSPDLKIQVIRIIQELVNNIVKHSQATLITVKLRERNRQLFIVVEDNGIGFSSDDKGMGLKNIENRLFIIEGSFKIKSENNKGTKVIIALYNGI